MGRKWYFLFVLAFSICLSLGATVSSRQAPVPTEKSSSGASGDGVAPLVDGLLHSEMTLAQREVQVAFVPTLKADDPLNRAVLAADSGTSRVPVAQLTYRNGTLRLGTLDLQKVGPPNRDAGDEAARDKLLAPTARYDLWLERTNSTWQILVAEGRASGELPKAPTIVGKIALSRHASPVVSPAFAAALIPTAGTAGQLVLRWGGYEALTDVRFTDQPPKLRERNGNGPPNVGIERGNFEDLSQIIRIRQLRLNNETALVLPDGKRLSVLFLRTLSAAELASGAVGGDRPTVTGAGLGADGVDYQRMTSVPDGAVVQLSQAPVPRVKIAAPLRFGSVVVRTENIAPEFPGMYGVWLKRVGNGWHLVFNNQPDVFGTQHDPKFDAAEVELTHTQSELADARPLGLAFVPTAMDRGRFLIVWGQHEWTADYVVGG
jgi:hypothetical protein